MVMDLGGGNSLYPRARRCGSAVIEMDGQLQLVAGLKSNLPGDAQTVPRAEIFALILLLQHAQNSSHLIYYTDHQPLRNNYHKGRASCRRTVNADLYEKIFVLCLAQCH